ncbi:MAG: fibronectin type III domain-containing protein [Candidatus Hodarchaeota archaeon]
MNNNSISIILIVSGILFIPVINYNLNFNVEYIDKIYEGYNINDFNNVRLKIFSFTENIHIDNNWSDAKTAGICSGSGTYSDPYRIEDMEIDSEGSGTCIWIENANDYFEIENCTILNGEVGIKLENTTNGVMRNNTIKNISGTRGLDNTGQYQSGYNGNNGIGILLHSSSNNILNNNTYENITGGDGGNGGLGGSGGAGGHGIGIYFLNSINNNISTNIFTNITGGMRGHHGGSSGDGTDGTGFGVYLEADSYQNIISADNIYEKDPIVYLFNKSNVIIENYSLEHKGIPLNLGQIVLINCNNVIIKKNYIVNFNGESGFSGGNNVAGETGGNSAGISVLYSLNITIFSNSIRNITGGTGGTSGRTAYSGNGGLSAGIFLKNTNESSIYNNTIYDVNGGIGGRGACIGAAGTGGISGGIIIENSIDNEIYTNIIFDITGGQGGFSSYGSKGGSGGIGSSIYFKNSRNNHVTNNSMRNIIGGNGKSGNAGGSGGEGGIAAGIYFDSSIENILNKNTLESIIGGQGGPAVSISAAGADTTGNGFFFKSDSYQNEIVLNNTLDGELILYFYNINNFIIKDYVLKNPTNPTNLGLISIIHCSNLTISNNNLAYHEGQGGKSGANYNHGGSGGDGNGIFILESNNLAIINNHIMHIAGGEGGAGGLQRSGGTGGAGNGIYLSNSLNNIITKNIILNMTGGKRGNLPWGGSWGISGIGRGIFAISSENSSISENALNTCTGGVEGYGIQLDSNTNETIIYFNFFTNNTINARDNGNNNTWDNGKYGNYWDDHIILDEDENGIVDQPYNISGTAGSRDHYPLAYIDLKTPNVTIINPLNNQFFETEPPDFIVQIVEEHLNLMWYEIEGMIRFFTNNGSIDQMIWENLEDGLITIKFCAIDLYGHIGESIVVVQKDATLPVITINAPFAGTNFGQFAPPFDISIDDPLLESIWYTIDGGITNITITELTGIIDQTLWNGLSNGHVIIIFYMSYGGGRIVYNQVVVIKISPISIPSAPQNLFATPGDNSAIISWTLPNDDGGSAVIRYNIYRGITSGQYVFLGTTIYTNFTDKTVIGGTMYYYVVTAVNSVGEGIFSSEVSTIPLGSQETPLTVPSAPLFLSQTVGDNFVHLSWNPPSNDGGSAITRYNIYRGTTSEEYIFVGITTTTNFNDTLLIGGITYFYVVTAINVKGESVFSNEVEATPPGISVPKSGSFIDLFFLLLFLGTLVIFNRNEK